MEEKYNWDLTAIFKDENDFNNAENELLNILEEIKKYRGTLSESVDNVYSLYKKLCDMVSIHERLYSYAMLKYHQDMSKQENIKLFKRVESLTTKVSEVESFISPEMSKISDEKLYSYLNDTRMQEFRKIIEDIIKEKKHILSEEVEEVLSKYSEIFGASENIYDIFTNTEFEYKDIIDDNGNKLPMDSARFSNYLMDKNVNIRKQAFESMYELYKKHINSITEMYLARVKAKTISSKIRNYNSSIDMATSSDDSNVEVYNTLLKEVNKNLYLNHEYIALKAKLLSLDKVHMYDVYVNSFEEDKDNIEYEDGKQIVLDALSILGEDYTNKLREAFDNRWIDVYKKENKMSGGYCLPINSLHPFVLLNYVNSSRDVSTIAHELGHTMHSVFASKNQNAINANYTIMIAEVASTVNEILLANYLINKEEDKKKKAKLINEQLDTIRATLYRQAMFAEFEKDVHQKIEEGESLTAENLNDIYYELVKKYFGEKAICDDLIKYEWARIPHFYSYFYVYKYSTGITSAIVIASKIMQGVEGYRQRYFDMLSKGGSIGSLDLLRMVDVDLEKEETYEEAFAYFKKLLKELEELI